MRRHTAFLAALVALTAAAPLAAAPATAPAEEKPKALKPADMVALAKALAPSFVRAEYTLKFDKGQPPQSYSQRLYAQDLVAQERPLEIPGLLLSDRLAIVADPMIHPRFVKGIAVRSGEELLPATVSAYALDEGAAFLELARPFKKAKPASFKPDAEGPYYMLDYFRRNAAWTVSIQSLPTDVLTDDQNRQYLGVPPGRLIVNAEGAPVGMTMNGYLPVGDSWKVSPQKWPALTAAQLAKMLESVETRAGKALLRVKLSFRSPRKGPEDMMRGGDEGEGSTEKNVIGVLTGAKQVLVLAMMKPDLTARLERMQVFPAEGEPVTASFAGTLTDYGGFLATLEKPIPAAVKLSSRNVRDYEDKLTPSAQVYLHGEKRQMYFAHVRIGGYRIGWRGQVYPALEAAEQNVFIFDARGDLLALPISRREKVSVESRYGRPEPFLTAAAYLDVVFKDLAAHVDPSNVPLSEAQENRLAWMGVELQALNQELARINKVSHLTNDGQTGAMVSYVYPDSPAAQAGVEPGDILVRLHVESHPKPLEVRVSEFLFSDRPFPWDRLDEVPERFFDRIPRPWPPAENHFTRALTELGFGKKYTAEFFHDGQIVNKPFAVVQSPPHFDTAPRHKDETLGMTVRDLTYEVRRYFQKKEKDPGVIVSKIEPGSKASVSGIKPYEIITHVNDKPVASVADFEKLIAGQEELRLSVLRMTRGRLVKIKMTGGAAPATAPAEP